MSTVQPTVQLSTALLSTLGAVRAETSIGSTNQYLLEQASSLPNFSVCLAREQTQGRGRRGKAWQSPSGSGFYGSLLWQPEQALSAYPPVSIMAALALGNAYRALRPGKPYTIKWPNDLLTPAGKVAGILVETQHHVNGRCSVVIGMGNNLLPPIIAEADSRQLAYPIGGLYDHEALSDDHQRTAAFWQVAEVWLSQLQGYLQNPPGNQALPAAWQEHDGFMGQAMVLRTPDGNTEMAIGKGVAEDGSLLIEQNGERRALSSGDWSIDWQQSHIKWRS